MESVKIGRCTYKIQNDIGSGGFSTVFRAKNKFGDQIAVKRLRLNQKGCKREDVLEEYRIQKQLLEEDPEEHIIKVLEKKEEPLQIALLMEYATGGDLLQAIDQHRIPQSMVHNLFVQIVSGTKFIHESGYIHRDLKPENIFLTGTYQVKIGDFGHAIKFMNGNEEKMMFYGYGTFEFAAPERFERGNHRGPPLDIWAMGLILLELANEKDFEWKKAIKSDPIYNAWRQGDRERFRGVHPQIMGLIEKMLDEDPEKRSSLNSIENDVWVKHSTNKSYSLRVNPRKRQN